MAASDQASAVVFTGVRIFDGTGSEPFPGEVRIDGERITQVARAAERVPRDGARIVESPGCVLMPGLVEAHAHLTWPTSVERLVPGMFLPLEDLTLNAARNARILLDHGFTSAYSAGALAPGVEVALAKHLDENAFPGPRLIPSTIEREPPGATDGFLATGAVEEHESGPEGVRAFVRAAAQSGVKAVKFLLNGENALSPGTSQKLTYSEEEVRAAGEQARESNVWLSAHAQAKDAIKFAIKHGFRVLYHCTYADAEAMDMLEAARDRIYVAPSIGIMQAILDTELPPFMDSEYQKGNAKEQLDLLSVLIPQLHKRGVKILPGGDYGFPFNPNGRNAWDLELWVRYFGFSPLEVLRAATELGGEIMGLAGELGLIKPGYLADLLLVDGDPACDVRILQDKARLRGIMKAGAFHKDPV
ncbi:MULTISPECIES: amidohydrolase family protein [unclassified Burkholderia]|uniref:amidohydrolase family protein n=1 Tax=unclassified Burkholderia TaxID=2613784 RepID=UPI002AAFDDA2|nr:MULTISPECIES: amidohydrolase family protein [unclassified Burkholderia]